ncbi:hypothetical protein [Helicobacter cynogastricus]|uniref:hypothetical protein n=1 Tax=Helicobacter cynogastricus TaxID=329937 RepID=UPI001F36CF1D|nr:hypothetical protein [Helicobacter cynogastricus]
MAEVVEITRGVLQSTPYIRAFAHATTNPKRAKGALFLALQSQDIQAAIENGAYGVLYDQSVEISDAEIAWIYVSNLDQALFRLLRYHLLGVCALYVSKATFIILSKITENSKVLFFEGAEVELLNLDLDQMGHVIFYNPQLKRYFEQEITLPTHQPFNILLEQLFSLSILYKDQRLDLHLPSFYAPDLAQALLACEMLGLEARLEHLGSVALMRPFYVNDALEPSAQGHKILVGGLEVESLQALLEYIHNLAPWHMLQIFSPMPLDTPCHIYKDLDHLKTLLHQPFSLGLIFGDVHIPHLLTFKHTSKSLFDEF